MAAPMKVNETIPCLEKQIAIARSELKNLRQQLYKLKDQHSKEVKTIKDEISSLRLVTKDVPVPTNKSNARSNEPIARNESGAERRISQHGFFTLKPIGFVSSLFSTKNGTPRQASICTASRGSLTIDKTLFTNPEHSLEGLEGFSHIWIMFIFHQNNNSYCKAKVKPPRLNGAKMGLFATRCPYRPNPIGLSLAKIEKIDGATIHLSGLDILDGTPVVDIKPYIPQYDMPSQLNQQTCSPLTSSNIHDAAFDNIHDAESNITHDATSNITHDATANKICDAEAKLILDAVSENFHDTVRYEKVDKDISFPLAYPKCETISKTENTVPNYNTDNTDKNTKKISESEHVANWLVNRCVGDIDVRFTYKAEKQQEEFSVDAKDEKFRLEYLKSPSNLKDAITDILREDPRSTYRRKNCKDSLYYFCIDKCHVTCWFDSNVAEVLKVQPVSDAEIKHRDA